MEVRKAARTVLIDQNGQIAIIHVKKLNYYKIPGGGIEQDETPAEAAIREAREESGCQASIIAPLGKIENDIPKWNMHDISEGFLAQVLGEKQLPEFEAHEQERGFGLEWHHDIAAAIEAIENNQAVDPSAAILQSRDLEFIKRAQNYLHEHPDNL